jgi:hypothetical protein
MVLLHQSTFAGESFNISENSACIGNLANIKMWDTHLTNQGRMLVSDGVLTERWRNRLLRRLRLPEVLCYGCGRTVDVGSRIHVSYGNGHAYIKPKIPRIYHTECFEGMFIDLGD